MSDKELVGHADGFPLYFSDRIPVLGGKGDVTLVDPITLFGMPVEFHPELPSGARVESIELLSVTDPATCGHPHDVVTPIPGGGEHRFCPQCRRASERRPIEVRPVNR